jgi:hypothetical protein
MNAPVARVAGSLRKRAKARAKALRMPLMPSLERRRLQCYLAFMIADVAALFTGFALSGVVRGGLAGWGELLLAQLLLPVYFVVAMYNGAYSADALSSREVSVARSMLGLMLAAIVTFITFYTKSSEHFSRIGLRWA